MRCDAQRGTSAPHVNPAGRLLLRLNDVVQMNSSAWSLAMKKPLCFTWSTSLVDSAARALSELEGSEVVTTMGVESGFAHTVHRRYSSVTQNRCFCEQKRMPRWKHAAGPNAAPGEAHARLGVVERRRMVLRGACGKCMQTQELP